MVKLNFITKLGLLCSLMSIINSFSVYGQEVVVKWERINPKYETPDAFVAALNVADYGADPTGSDDQTKLFQGLLDKLGSRQSSSGGIGNGGTLYLPEGKYLIKGTLVIPKGVTIRGDWQKPEKGSPIKGTILVANNPSAKGNDAGVLRAYEQQSLIIMQPSSAVRDLNIWYPEQNAANIVAYPPAILLGDQSYFGNEYTLASNITLVNAYDGIIFSRRNGGGAPNCYEIYGTPLKRGIEIDNIAEVGRINEVDFSPDYWAGSGLPGAPELNGPHKNYIYENATAVVMRRNDWSFICKVKAEGYNIGYRMDWSFSVDNDGNRTSPNGHNYGMEFTNCKYGVYAAAVAGAGMMFYEYKFTGCDYGFYLEENPKGVIQIQGSEFDTKVASIYAPTTSITKILVNQCTFSNGAVDIRGGLSSIVGCDFNSQSSEHIILGINARSTITGNRFSGEPKIMNRSIYECFIDHTPIEMTKLLHFPYKKQDDFKQKPAGNGFYNATLYGVNTDANDNSGALQAVLNQAKANGGGIVFLPTGHYNFRQPITIPTGVELKGSVDVPTLPTGPGSVLEIYVGKGEGENGTPFISMEQGSGIRGLSLNYPEQSVKLLYPTVQLPSYSYAIRGNADVYIVNIAIRACYRGLDLFTNKCDNHYVDYLAGHVFKSGIRVGGGSLNGHIYNSQFNQIAYGCGNETKYGIWPNSPLDNGQSNPDKEKEFDAAYAYSWNNLDFLVLENCEDQILYNNFDFGSNRGVVLSSDNGKGASGISLGTGIDQGMNSFYIAKVGNKGFNFINTQIVTTAPGSVELQYRTNNRYIQVDPAFNDHVVFFGSDFWGQPQEISNDVLNGHLEMQAANYENSGQKVFAAVKPNAKFELIGSNINPVNTLLGENTNPQFFIQSSIVNSKGVDTISSGLWINNLEHSGSVSPNAGAFLDRTGWIATGSVYNDDAPNSLDSNFNTRWSTLSDRQKPGQWFMVDMRSEQTFTGIYMDAGSASYNPVSFTVSVSSDGETWTDVASANSVGQLVFEKQNARYVRVTQTGTGSSAWRITEFFVMNTDVQTSSIDQSVTDSDVNTYFASDELYIDGLLGKSNISIYTITGQRVMTTITDQTHIETNLLRGVYIVLIENGGIVYRKKVMKL